MNLSHKEKIIIIITVVLGLVSTITGLVSIEYGVGPNLLFYSHPIFVLSGFTGLLMWGFSPFAFVSGLGNGFGTTEISLTVWISIPFFIHVTKGITMKKRVSYIYFMGTYLPYVLNYLYSVSDF